MMARDPCVAKDHSMLVLARTGLGAKQLNPEDALLSLITSALGSLCPCPRASGNPPASEQDKQQQPSTERVKTSDKTPRKVWVTMATTMIWH